MSYYRQFILISGLGLAAAAAASTGKPAATAAGNPVAQHLTVALSDPSKPARIKASTIQGSITVEAFNGNDVEIEAIGRDDDERDGDEPAIAGDRDREGDRDHRRQGLKKIANIGGGVEAVEESNEVVISSRSMNHPLDLKILVPAASSVTVSTINDGEVRVKGVRGELDLHNTNGDITAEDVAGPVTASTVNGDVKITFTKAAASAMAFSTLNGDIDITFPADLKADVRLRSDNGDLYSDFDVVLEPRGANAEESRDGKRHRLVLGRDMVGRINGGGPEIIFKTFNGDVLLRRRKP